VSIRKIKKKVNPMSIEPSLDKKDGRDAISIPSNPLFESRSTATGQSETTNTLAPLVRPMDIQTIIVDTIQSTDCVADDADLRFTIGLDNDFSRPQSISALKGSSGKVRSANRVSFSSEDSISTFEVERRTTKTKQSSSTLCGQICVVM
jgi:hypothetical protein